MLSLISTQNSRCSNPRLHPPPPIWLPWWSDQVKKRATFVDIKDSRCVTGFTLSKVSQSITGPYLVSVTHPLNSNMMGCLGPSAPEWFLTSAGPVLITALFLFWHKWEQNTLPDKRMIFDLILASWQSGREEKRSAHSVSVRADFYPQTLCVFSLTSLCCFSLLAANLFSFQST